MDASSLPSCSKVLEQELKRVHFIVKRWKNCLKTFGPLESPLDFGWILNDKTYQPHWYEGPIALRVLDVVCKEDGEEKLRRL